ncbi:hypothetical protein [Streptomyces showdoensis]|uniref:hypothetical protein n=1 Tax=Streptomyces showdoensis TaxID=68268 RepID=UPI000F5147B1|nr:hypothetical protein [Streptomyces showdoensis]
MTALAGVGVIVASGPLWPFEEADLADNAAMVARFDDTTMWWAFATQVAFTLAAFGSVLFGAGLKRRLERQCPAGSLVPMTAFLGMLLTGALSLAGCGMGTEAFHQIRNRAASDPDTVMSSVGQLGTYGWLWSGLLLTAGALAVAAFRQGAVARWIGVVSVAFGLLLAVTQLTPFQYLALMVGVPYLLVLGAAFALGRRAPA